jgi:ferric-dicitrate binding protein FerR (iron transport regulator)
MVIVEHGSQSAILKPGQQASWSQTANKFVTYYADVDEAVAWKDGYFLFNNKTSLATLMRQFERWYDIDVDYEGDIPEQSFGGGIQRSLPLSGVLSILKQSGIRFKVDGKKLTVLK